MSSFPIPSADSKASESENPPLQNPPTTVSSPPIKTNDADNENKNSDSHKTPEKKDIALQSDLPSTTPNLKKLKTSSSSGSKTMQEFVQTHLSPLSNTKIQNSENKTSSPEAVSVSVSSIENTIINSSPTGVSPSDSKVEEKRESVPVSDSEKVNHLFHIHPLQRFDINLYNNEKFGCNQCHDNHLFSECNYVYRCDLCGYDCSPCCLKIESNMNSFKSKECKRLLDILNIRYLIFETAGSYRGFNQSERKQIKDDKRRMDVLAKRVESLVNRFAPDASPTSPADQTSQNFEGSVAYSDFMNKSLEEQADSTVEALSSISDSLVMAGTFFGAISAGAVFALAPPSGPLSIILFQTNQSLSFTNINNMDDSSQQSDFNTLQFNLMTATFIFMLGLYFAIIGKALAFYYKSESKNKQSFREGFFRWLTDNCNMAIKMNSKSENHNLMTQGSYLIPTNPTINSSRPLNELLFEHLLPGESRFIIQRTQRGSHADIKLQQFIIVVLPLIASVCFVIGLVFLLVEGCCRSVQSDNTSSCRKEMIILVIVPAISMVMFVLFRCIFSRGRESFKSRKTRGYRIC